MPVAIISAEPRKDAMTADPKYLKAECGVRYWEDATVNGIEDTDGSLIPLRQGDAWKPLIELATGRIAAWPEGVTADIHYKVCDAGRYTLLAADLTPLRDLDGYVPGMLSPGGRGYGDYVIMKVGPDGQIENWRADLSYFDAD